MRAVALLFLAFAVGASAAELTLAFEPRWRGQPITVPSAELRNDAGQSLRITRLAGLISGVALVRADGGRVELQGQYGLVDLANGRDAVLLRDVPVGDYAGVSFQLGLSEAVNHGDPGRWPAAHPLNPLVNHLHWSWKGGYVFVALEGQWERGAGVAGERGFSYHLAGDEHVMTVRFAAALTVERATKVQFAIDLARVLAGGKLAVEDGSDTTHSAAGDPVAARMTAVMPRAFFWLGAEASAPNQTAAVPPEEPVAVGAHAIAFRVPAGFPAPSLPMDNPLTEEGVRLGRRLFRDQRLSVNGRQSCADCHDPERAFSDSVALSRGADGRRGRRNAMPLFNLAWSPSYAWDGSKPRVRDQVLAAMTNPVEMHADAAKTAVTLSADADLRSAFAAAFGSDEVTVDRIGLALEQFLLTTVSADARFDRAREGKAELTEEEKEGFALFMTEYDPARGRRGADCFHCHGGALFTDYDFKNNGLDRESSDGARLAVTHRPADAGKFKTPSLRNVALTAPYMHDGRFRTLEEVVAHYDHDVIRSPTLDPNLAKHPDDGLKLTSAEQHALVAFLKTLTDAQWEGATVAR